MASHYLSDGATPAKISRFVNAVMGLDHRIYTTRVMTVEDIKKRLQNPQSPQISPCCFAQQTANLQLAPSPLAPALDRLFLTKTLSWIGIGALRSDKKLRSQLFSVRGDISIAQSLAQWVMPPGEVASPPIKTCPGRHVQSIAHFQTQSKPRPIPQK